METEKVPEKAHLSHRHTETHKTPSCSLSICAPKHKRATRRISSSSFMTLNTTRRSSIEVTRARKTETNIAAHFLTPSQLSKILVTNLETGLSELRAAEQLVVDGPNALPHTPDLSLLKIFVSNLFGWFPLLLWSAGSLALFIHFIQYVDDDTAESNENLYLGIIIIAVIIFTGFFAFYQEAKNHQVMKGFKELIPLSANVIREGKLREVPVENLVVGDLVEMSAGEVVPADVRLIQMNNFRIDMSSITGEAEPQSRTLYYTNENPLETKNLAFFSCQITDGSARGIVVATGGHTVIGKIADLTEGLQKEETPIAMEIKHFIEILTILALILGGFFFLMVTIIQSNWVAGFYYFTGIIIANVPEGLLVTLTVSLTLTAKKLAKKNCLVKKLQSVETLGAMSCICSDKTGTLTENRMTVSHLAFDYRIQDAKESFESDIDKNPLLRAACLCLKAEFIDDTSSPADTRRIRGDASESAILRYLEKGYNANKIRNANPKVSEIPFNSTTKYHISIHVLESSNSHLIVLKGAPEIVLEMCSTVWKDGQTVQLTQPLFKNVKHMCTDLGNKGERVLGYCDLDLPVADFQIGFKFNSETPNFPLKGFRFLGLISLIDPPRTSVPDALAKCRSAGIKVIMVTGDHPITALSISRKVGIISMDSRTAYDDAFEANVEPKAYMKTIDPLKYKTILITGDDLRAMSAHQLDMIVENMDEIIFARTSPQQKLFIVEACQRIGHVVAVTGDGVNDSPALKKADIGIAMGITGTDVSKQAADMILMDDNFSSIILGVEEGRLIFDNLKKSIAFTLTSNLPEMVPFILYATIGIPLPLHALLIICINVLTDLWPAISLAYEKAERDIMHKPPRDLQNDHLVTWNLIKMAYFQVGVIQLAAAMTGYFTAYAAFGFYPSDLLFTRERWDSMGVNDFTDSYGQEWSYEDRKKLETLAQSSYYATVVTVQIADIIICKTRRLSIIHQGMTNHMLNFGILFEISITMVILYVPFFNSFLYTQPVPWVMWIPGIPFAILIILLDELRRYLIRKYPNGWVERELYY